MEVKDIFELRKQGKAEEAYAAIRPMYAQHQGHYTTIAMFWCASDIIKVRLEQQKVDEALSIFQALVRLYPNMDDADGKGHQAILRHAIGLADSTPKFSMIDFLENGGLDSLIPNDWKASEANGHPLPSIAARLISHVYHELEDNPTPELGLRCMPVLQEALKHSSTNMNYRRLMALIYKITGERKKAIDIYKQILKKHRQSYLYSELAELATQPANKIPLICKAILEQREEKFRTKLYIQLAELLQESHASIAAFMLTESIRIRQANGYHVSQQQTQLIKQFNGITIASAVQARQFLKEQADRVRAIIQ